MSKQKLMLYTDEQIEVLDALTKATGESYAELVRRLIASESARHGLTFPQNMPTRDETIRDAQKKRWKKD